MVMADMATKPWHWPAFRIGLHQSSLGLSETAAQMITLSHWTWIPLEGLHLQSLIVDLVVVVQGLELVDVRVYLLLLLKSRPFTLLDGLRLAP